MTREEERNTGKIKEALCQYCKESDYYCDCCWDLIVALLGIHFPVIVDKTINSVAQLATPLALIVIGAGFEGRKALAKIKPTLCGIA